MTELTHWGIKGQHWGVRRFRTEDGTYTPAGRERYLKSKQEYKSNKTAQNKLQMKRDKDLYKRAKKADQGRKLYEKGKTITSNEDKIAARKRAQKAVAAVSGLAMATAVYYEQSGGRKNVRIKNRNLSLSEAVGIAAIGATVLSGLGTGAANKHNSSQNEKMRAYWHRSKDVKDLNKNAKNPAYGG